MTNEEKQILAELGERIRDTGKFYPAPGTKDLKTPWRVVCVSAKTEWFTLAARAVPRLSVDYMVLKGGTLRSQCIPDLADPATLGIVEQQALDAVGNEAASVAMTVRRSVVTGNAKIEAVVLSADGRPTFVEEPIHLLSPMSLKTCRAIAVATVFLSAVRQKGG